MRGGRRRGQMMLAGAIVTCLLAGAPAANAVFSRTINAGTMSVGTYSLAAPTGNKVPTATCSAIGGSGKYRLNITVTGHGTVAKATHYVLTVRDKDGNPQFTTLLSPGAAPFSTMNAARGWGYTIDAQYRTTSTTWSSAAPLTTACL